MERFKNRKTAINTAVGLAVGLIILFFIKQIVYAPPSFDKAMVQTASALNENCPMMIDQDTRLDNVFALPDNIFQYNYTLINFIKDSIDINAMENYMRPIILNIIKTNPDLKLFRDNKTTMAYIYKDMNGVFLSKITIKAEDYLDKE